MGIRKMLFGNGKNDNKDKYLCWMCDDAYSQPGDFLNHIRACKQKQASAQSVVKAFE